jgi:hypothetical protein
MKYIADEIHQIISLELSNPEFKLVTEILMDHRADKIAEMHGIGAADGDIATAKRIILVRRMQMTLNKALTDRKVAHRWQNIKWTEIEV